MKTIYGTILVLITAAAMLLTVPPACRAVEKEQENIWSEHDPKLAHCRWELTDERVERMMGRLRQTNPEKAKELAKLREKDPEKFKTELRKVMHKKFYERHKQQEQCRAGRGPQHKWGPPSIPGMHGERMGRQPRTMRMREKHAEYFEWLKKNYPQEAEKLAGLKDRKPKLHTRQMVLSLKKYRRIFEAEKENPQLAKVLKEDLQLKEERNKLLRKIRASTNDAEKKQLTKELEKVVSVRFDLIVKRKQIEYEQLSKKLEKLKERVKRSEAEVQKWENVKKVEVKQRLEELISRTEKFNWD
jgi:hypothetical protein